MNLTQQLYETCCDALKKLEWPIYTEQEIETMAPCRTRLKIAIARYEAAAEIDTEMKAMTVKEALELIIENKQCPALSHCYNYAKAAYVYLHEGQLAELRIQLMYVVSNMARWHAGSTTTATSEQITTCRAVLKAAI